MSLIFIPISFAIFAALLKEPDAAFMFWVWAAIMFTFRC